MFERTPGEATRPLLSRWRRREPERTALHAVVRGHLADLLTDAMRARDFPMRFAASLVAVLPAV